MKRRSDRHQTLPACARRYHRQGLHPAQRQQRLVTGDEQSGAGRQGTGHDAVVGRVADAQIDNGTGIRHLFESTKHLKHFVAGRRGQTQLRARDAPQFGQYRFANQQLVLDGHHLEKVRALARFSRPYQLPSCSMTRSFVLKGGLLRYPVVLGELDRPTAEVADRILRGAPPATLPMQ